MTGLEEEVRWGTAQATQSFEAQLALGGRVEVAFVAVCS